MSNTQITSPIGYNINRVIFGNPVVGTVPSANPIMKLTYKRIPIMTKNIDGSVGELVFSTSELFSFGVSESKAFDDASKVNGYVMPLCLHNKNGATEDEKAFTNTFDAVIEKCKEYLLEQKDELELYDLTSADMKKMNPIYYKKEKGKVVEGSTPTLYAKLILSKKQNKIITQFYNENDEPLDPLSLMGKYCYVKAAVKFESIFVGAKLAVQVKLYEAEVKLLETGMKRLLPSRPKTDTKVTSSNSSTPFNELSKNPDEIDNTDDEIPPQKLIIPEDKKPVAKKVVAKKVVGGGKKNNE